jgi:hypothetical protein
MQLKNNRAQLVIEPAKREGIHYALTEQGVELAIIDVTHRAFEVSWSDASQRSLEERLAQQQAALAKLPGWLRNLMLWIYLRKSLLARGIRQSRGTYLSGMGTYLLKLGADNLPSVLATAADTEIAAALPAVAVRLRMQEIAQLTAEAATLALAAADPGQPLFLLNIAGGPAIDSLNSLIIFRRDQPTLLVSRRIVIRVLDVDTEGPLFGRDALEALAAPGGPLHGIDIAFRNSRYDWTSPSLLQGVLAEANSEKAAIVVSSEGGLFEYGSDNDIIDNLEQLRTCSNTEVTVIGSVTRADELTRNLHRAGGAAVRCRGLEAFSALAARARYGVLRSIELPLSDVVVLVPDAASKSERIIR